MQAFLSLSLSLSLYPHLPASQPRKKRITYLATNKHFFLLNVDVLEAEKLGMLKDSGVFGKSQTAMTQTAAPVGDSCGQHLSKVALQVSNGVHADLLCMCVCDKVASDLVLLASLAILWKKPGTNSRRESTRLPDLQCRF